MQCGSEILFLLFNINRSEMEKKIIFYILFIAGIFAFSIFLNTFLYRYLKNIRRRNSNDEVRWNDNKKPAIGGITFYISFLLAAIALLYKANQWNDFNIIQFYGIILALSLGFLTGLFDDSYRTIPWLKLLLQIACGIILICTGTFISIFNNDVLNYLFTVFWVVGIMNSINLLDNMDSIASVVVFFIIISFIVSIYVFNAVSIHYFLLLLGLSVSLLVFFRYNYYPSKIFMGDSGSMFLGVFISAFGIIYLWNFNTDDGKIAPVIVRLYSVACIFALPIIDTSTVFIKRLFIKRKSPFIGGKDHTTHHLSYIGISDRKIAWIFAALAALNAFLGIIVLWHADVWNWIYMLIFGSWVFMLFAVLFIIANLNTVSDETK